MDINGVAHIVLTAGDYEKSTAFYRALLPSLGMTLVLDNEFMLYGVGARTAVGVRPPDERHAGDKFVQTRVGLHHLCFRAKSRETVDEVFQWVLARDDATVVHEPEESSWAPGYYSVLFEDPDGVRLEVNHVPGKGLLDNDAGKTEQA